MVEEWKDIKGFEGFYKVSNLGRVKSLSRVVNTYKGTKRNGERILKPKRKLMKNSYLTVCMSRKGMITTAQVHVLVADAFLPKPNCKVEVNHKNGIKSDNRAENLEWVTRKQNILHSARVLGQHGVAVRCVETNEVFKSQTQAAERYGIAAPNICTATKIRTRTCGGYHWERVKL